MRRLLIGGALGVVVVCVRGLRRSRARFRDRAGLQLQGRHVGDRPDREEQFHEATTMKDIDLMMSLWAPNATLTVGPDVDRGRTGRDPAVLARRSRPRSRLRRTGSPDHPAYKLAVTVNGDRGTLHFECHYVDYESEKVAAVTVGDLDVARIDGRWLITNFVAGIDRRWPLKPVSDAGADGTAKRPSREAARR